MELIPLRPIIEHMRALGWYESHLFSHSYLSGEWCVGVWPDAWTLSRATPTPGIYKIQVTGTTLADLTLNLRATQVLAKELL